jgi:hypothetical protein
MSGVADCGDRLFRVAWVQGDCPCLEKNGNGAKVIAMKSRHVTSRALVAENPQRGFGLFFLQLFTAAAVVTLYNLAILYAS